VVRLHLSDGDWIDVKQELNAGEQRQIYAGLVKDMRAGETPTLDPEKVGLTRILAYLVGWSFVDASGRPVAYGESAVKNLDMDTYREIDAAIAAHDDAADKARDEKKMIPAGSSSSEAT
jgi:hypothetical protein